MSVAADEPRAMLSEREEVFDRARLRVGDGLDTRVICSGVLFDLAGAVVLSLGLTPMANLVGLA